MPANAHPNTRRTELLTVPEVSAWTRLSVRSVWALLASGELTAIRFGRRATRVDAAEVERSIDDARRRSARS